MSPIPFGVLDSTGSVSSYPTGDFTETFQFTGQTQIWNRPKGTISNIVIEAYGAQGGGNARAGLGGQVVAQMTTVPRTLRIEVGGAGVTGPTEPPGGSRPGGYNGGGAVNGTSNAGSGGGATDIRLSSPLTSRILVAGGGGGPSNAFDSRGRGGDAGGVVGSQGAQLGGGGGGTQVSGGSAGASTNMTLFPTSGGLGFGGSGGSSVPFQAAGGGGGGGGYYGGGGGGNGTLDNAGGGGGGSSYANTDYFTDITNTGGVNSGNGFVTISYTIS